MTGTAVLFGGGAELKRKIGKESDQANPRSKFFIDEKIVSANPS